MKTTPEKCSKYSGADWMQSYWARRGIVPSGLAVKVADILGQVFQGVYHVDDHVLDRRIDWRSPDRIQVVLYNVFATYDNAHLTLLVLCCLAAKVKYTFGGAAKGYASILCRCQPLDMDTLIRLLQWCHAGAVRAELRGRSPSSVQVYLTQRQREGETWRRHPSMEAAIEILSPCWGVFR